MSRQRERMYWTQVQLRRFQPSDVGGFDPTPLISAGTELFGGLLTASSAKRKAEAEAAAATAAAQQAAWQAQEAAARRSQTTQYVMLGVAGLTTVVLIAVLLRPR